MPSPRPPGRVAPAPRDPFGGRKAVALIAPGLEETLAAELSGLGIDGQVEPGGVAFRADWSALDAVTGRSWLTSHLLLRVATVPAATLEELAHGVRLLPWGSWVLPRQPLDVVVTSHRSHLRRREAVADKVRFAIGDALRGPRVEGPRPPREPVRVVVRVLDNRAELSVDAAGGPLDDHGWRQATAKAPLKEHLAAAALRLAGWTPSEPLVDPMCGAGTFPILAARMAAGLPPRLARELAWTRWPGAPRTSAPSRPPTASQVVARIAGSDREAGAIQASTSNARRAGVTVPFTIARFEDLLPPADRGLLVANPPWGHRVGDASTIPWRRWGELLTTRWAAWRFVAVLPSQVGPDDLGLPIRVLARFESGGVPVRIVSGR